MSIDPKRTSPPKKGGMARYLVPLVLLVVIIGGVAWVAQHLDKWGSPPKVNPDSQSSSRSPLEFPRKIALWGQRSESGEEKMEPKDYEPGQKGHYDFPFKNTSKEDVEIIYFNSSCDCTSVLACAFDEEETKRLQEQHNDSPASPLSYAGKVQWRDLPKDADWFTLTPAAKKEKGVLIKPNAGGVVRVQWTASKSGGTPLNVSPKVRFRPADSNIVQFEQPLIVPLMVSAPVRFYPTRVTAGALTIGSSTTTEFYAYSTTRDHFDIQLTNEPLFEVTTTPLKVGGIFSRGDIPSELSAALEADKTHPHLRSAQRVSMTVHESRGGKYLDLGTYFRKLTVKLDGFPNADIMEPEVVGRVHGEIIIGGSDDQGRVRLKDFRRADGKTRTVELSTDVSWKLEKHLHEPAWLQVELTEVKERSDAKRRIWRLKVTIPENARGVRSLDDPDAVVLRVLGPTERFVRIPIEGQLLGQ